MVKSYDVSVIVATYNPDWEKLKATLVSIVSQKNINIEVIVTDDGSKDDYFLKIQDFFQKASYSDYVMLKNVNNIGTVKNLYGAIQKAQGNYIFATSPGDMLYDENTLSKIYGFAVYKNIDICFGDAVFYKRVNGKITILENYKNAPLRSDGFDENISLEDQKVMFLLGNYILGASFFRKRDVALKYIGKIKNICKYVEDNTSTAFALADDIRVYHFQDYLVWYEYGTGVSTNKEVEWKRLLDNDFRNSFLKLQEDYKNDSTIQTICYSKLSKNKILAKLRLIFSTPNMYFKKKTMQRMKKSIGNIHPVNKTFIENYFR